MSSSTNNPPPNDKHSEQEARARESARETPKESEPKEGRKDTSKRFEDFFGKA